MTETRTTDKAPARHGSRRRETSHRISDQAADLNGISPAVWNALSDEDQRGLIENLDQSYKEYLGNLYKSADLCVDRYNELTRNHRRWRHTAIIGAGLLACLNFMAASNTLKTLFNGSLPIIAAIAALLLAVLANLETFSNSAEKAQSFRESRELFLDSAQEFDRVWTVYVVALGGSIEAYSNAAELYKRMIIADGELRSKFKELNKDRKG